MEVSNLAQRFSSKLMNFTWDNHALRCRENQTLDSWEMVIFCKSYQGEISMFPVAFIATSPIHYIPLFQIMLVTNKNLPSNDSNDMVNVLVVKSLFPSPSLSLSLSLTCTHTLCKCAINSLSFILTPLWTC